MDGGRKVRARHDQARAAVCQEIRGALLDPPGLRVEAGGRPRELRVPGQPAGERGGERHHVA